eukprot:Sspe_Gene.50957::Locus_28300_Transcript_1_1_Confidence_1.000_Length_1718::g.50957::m.50957
MGTAGWAAVHCVYLTRRKKWYSSVPWDLKKYGRVRETLARSMASLTEFLHFIRVVVGSGDGDAELGALRVLAPQWQSVLVGSGGDLAELGVLVVRAVRPALVTHVKVVDGNLSLAAPDVRLQARNLSHSSLSEVVPQIRTRLGDDVCIRLRSVVHGVDTASLG